ncbi:hypothetical protein [Alteribacter aurantiacus]|uniref:hypothetical protein n=1 Tax=Alteribacter aurantiacus TaxID=254410 RepID=UPI0004107A46|nr:hypothetical protein [Alteribacter aurantiacus]
MTTALKSSSTVTEMDLLKSVLHKLAHIERAMVKKEDLTFLNKGMGEAIEQMAFLQEDILEFKRSVEAKHIENINSDEVILRSFLEMSHQRPSHY